MRVSDFPSGSVLLAMVGLPLLHTRLVLAFLDRYSRRIYPFLRERKVGMLAVAGSPHSYEISSMLFPREGAQHGGKHSIFRVPVRRCAAGQEGAHMRDH
jgi:hypothetical protein